MNTTCGNWPDQKTKDIAKEIWDFYNKISDGKLILQKSSVPDKAPFSHYRFWEYAMCLRYTNPQPGDWVLDIGGSNSLLSWFLASKGCNVVTIDLNETNVHNANKNNKYLNLQTTNILGDMSIYQFDRKFKYIYSVCVVEHIMELARRSQNKGEWKNYWLDPKYNPTKEELDAEDSFMRNVGVCLEKDGIAAITYALICGAKSKYNGAFKRCSYYRNEEDVRKRLVNPTELKLCFPEINIKTVDNEYPIGAIFLTQNNKGKIIKAGHCYDQKYLFNNIFPNTPLSSGISVLQVGARGAGAIGIFNGFQSYEYKTFHVLEIWPKNIEWCKTQPIIQKAVCGDVRKINEYKDLLDKYDVIIHHHGPEHLTKEEFTNALPKIMDKCNIAFIVGCPWGKWEQPALDGNKYEEHLHHWMPNELSDLGFIVYTLGNGPNQRKPMIGVLYK